MNDINFNAIYKSIDREVFLKKVGIKILLWSITIAFSIFLIGGILGWFGYSNRCGYSDRTHDVECWNPDPH